MCTCVLYCWKDTIIGFILKYILLYPVYHSIYHTSLFQTSRLFFFFFKKHIITQTYCYMLLLLKFLLFKSCLAPYRVDTDSLQTGFWKKYRFQVDGLSTAQKWINKRKRSFSSRNICKKQYLWGKKNIPVRS